MKNVVYSNGMYKHRKQNQDINIREKRYVESQNRMDFN